MKCEFMVDGGKNVVGEKIQFSIYHPHLPTEATYVEKQ